MVQAWRERDDGSQIQERRRIYTQCFDEEMRRFNLQGIISLLQQSDAQVIFHAVSLTEVLPACRARRMAMLADGNG